MTDFDFAEYDRLKTRVDQARTDLDELAEQVESGEIDVDTASQLRAGYESELESAEAELAALGTPPKRQEKPAPVRAPAGTDAPRKPMNTRIIVGAAVLLVAFTGILFAVTRSADPEASAAPSPTATPGDDPCAELAAAVDDHPGNALRLSLANCYVGTGQAMSAIEHYRFVLESAESTPEETSEASWGMGVLNYQIGQVQESVAYMRDALEDNPENPDAKFWLSMLLVYEVGTPDEAIPYLEELATMTDLPEQMRADVEAALAVARGEEVSP